MSNHTHTRSSANDMMDVHQRADSPLRQYTTRPGRSLSDVSRLLAPDENEVQNEHLSVPLFTKGFKRFLDTQLLSDLTIKTEEDTFQVHRIILAYSSDFFRSLLTGDFKERTQSVVELKFPDNGKVFPQALQFMYTGEVDITPDNAIPLLAMADQYLISELKVRVESYISTNITKRNVVPTLRRVVQFKAGKEILAKCLMTVARNFTILSEKAVFDFLPPATMLELLGYRQLAVKNEWIVYSAVSRYVEARNKLEPLSEEQATKLFECVRYSFLTYDQLKEVEKNPLVPRNLLIEGLFYRLRRSECPDQRDERTPVPRPSYGLHFEYKYDFDKNGIIYWFTGSDFSNGRVVNPLRYEINNIHVTCSSIEKGTVDWFITNKPSEVWTKDVPSSWVCFDLGPNYKVQPSMYTLRHGGNYKADSLRNWDFQGSTDGETWRVLRRHNTDTSLNDKFTTSSWPIDDIHEAFRYFRIVQKGHNSSNHNFLVLCGFELYGTLYENV